MSFLDCALSNLDGIWSEGIDEIFRASMAATKEMGDSPARIKLEAQSVKLELQIQ